MCCLVVVSITAFATEASRQGRTDVYLDACVMALHFGANLSDEDSDIQRHLAQLLIDLEPHIINEQAILSPSLRRTLDLFASRQRDIVRPEFIDAVDRLMNTALVGEADDQGRAFRHLRTLYSNRRPQRQSAVLPAEHLEEHGLSLPDLTTGGTVLPQNEIHLSNHEDEKVQL